MQCSQACVACGLSDRCDGTPQDIPDPCDGCRHAPNDLDDCIGQCYTHYLDLDNNLHEVKP